MKELQFKHHSAAACYQRHRYYGNRSHGNHRTLVGIEILFHGCTDVFNFVAQATLAAGMLKDAEELEFVEYLGGSTYRAFVSDAEGKAWLLGFVREMGLTQAIIAAHRRTTGRLDFHILTPDRDETGRRLLTAENRVRARLVATGLTEELNKRRVEEKRFVLGNIRVGPYHREVYYLKKEDLQPQLEIETKTPEAPVAEVEVIRRRDYVSQAYYLKREETPALETERSAPSTPSQAKPEVAAEPGPGGDRRAQGAPSGESPAPAKLPLRGSHTLAKEEPHPSRGAADGKPSGKAESASRTPSLQGRRLPGGTTTSSEDEEEKRRKKERLEKERRERDRREQERLRQLQELRDRCDARELLIYLESLNHSGAGDSKRPPEPWLEFAERARLYVPDPNVRFSARLFIEDVLPKLVFAMVDLDGGVPRGQRDLMARCFKVRDAILEPPEKCRGSRDREL